MSQNVREYLDPAIAIAREAGEIIMEYYEGGHAREMVKSDNSAVTDADLAADKLITEKITALTPDIPVVTEEGVEAGNIPDVSGGQYWLCDPLDGTVPFIKKMDTFLVQMGFVDGFEPVLGIAHYPALHETYYAIKGHGTFHINHTSNKTTPIKLSRTSGEYPVITSNPLYNDPVAIKNLFIDLPEENFLFEEKFHVRDIINGHVDIMAINSRGVGGEWDLSAFKLLLEEAGGALVWLEEDFHFGNPTQNLIPMAFLSHPDLKEYLKS